MAKPKVHTVFKIPHIGGGFHWRASCTPRDLSHQAVPPHDSEVTCKACLKFMIKQKGLK